MKLCACKQEKLHELLRDVSNTAFQCGEWADDSDEDYAEAFERSEAAEEALLRFIEEEL